MLYGALVPVHAHTPMCKPKWMLLSNEGEKKKQNSTSSRQTKCESTHPNILTNIQLDTRNKLRIWYRFGSDSGGGESYDFASYAYVLYFNVAQNRGH